MLTALDEKQIFKFNQRLDREITITLTDSEHPSYPKLKDFCDALARLVPQVNITKDSESPKQPPRIVLHSGLRYQSVPTGHELQPFLEALTFLGPEAANLDIQAKTTLEEDKLPADLSIFIAPQCTFCPAAVRRLIPLPLVDDKIQLNIIDGTLFPELAEHHSIEAVPTVLLDERFRWTGSVPLEEIISTINTRDPISLGANSLENILKEGQAGQLAAMMLEAGVIFPAFKGLLVHDKWPVRLGAMVVMEEIAAQNPVMACGLNDFLWDRFGRLPDQIKGDILYLFGEIGDRRTQKWLDEVLAGDYDEEIKEAAKEALDKL